MRVCDCISHMTWINVRFHGDGLGSSCTAESYDSTEDFLYVATSCISFVIVVFFAYLGCTGVFRYKKMIWPLKMLFFFASTASISFTLLSITTITLCLTSYKKAALIVGSMSTFIYAFLFLCIWANLILRLFVAFRGSMYKMTDTQRNGYLAVFAYLVLNAFATSVCQLLMLVGEGLAPSIYVQFGLGVVFMIVFAISSMVAVCSFVGKVFVLGKSRTKKQVKVFNEAEPIALNKMQETLMHLSAKYVSLFLLASFSSAIAMFSGFYESASDIRISLFLVPFDCCVNLICIYLQYAFAEKQYLRFCSKLDWSCKRCMTAGWVQSIHTMRRDERDLEVKEEKRIEMAIQMGVDKEIDTIAESANNEMNTTKEPAGTDVEGVDGAHILVSSSMELEKCMSIRKDSHLTEQAMDPKQIADFFNGDERE